LTIANPTKTGIIPMFDMINHSVVPNIGLSFDGSNFELIALREIDENEEFFICYTREISSLEHDNDSLSSWDEDSAVWTLIQWGVPQSPPKELARVPNSQSEYEKMKSVLEEGSKLFEKNEIQQQILTFKVPTKTFTSKKNVDRK
jgi:hypothetical protein